MEESLASHVKLPGKTAHPHLPQLRLELSASKRLSLTVPYHISFTFEHESGHEGMPLFFEWSTVTHGFKMPGLVLLHHTAVGLESIAVDHSERLDVSRHGPIIVNGWNENLWELDPKGSFTLMSSLPGRYQKLLETDETYTLLWPGAEIALWEYGTVREHLGQELDDKDQRLLLPGGPHITFSTHTENEPWPDRAATKARIGFDRANFAEETWRHEQARAKDTFPRASIVERGTNAPVLTLTLECPSKICHGETVEAVVRVTYEAEASARPVTFHTNVFQDNNSYQTGRLKDGNWVNYDDDSGCGYRIMDDPDVLVTVGQSEHFVSLEPGESWTTSQRLGIDWYGVPDDAKYGEVFRYVFCGETLDWWNWGSKAEHEKTVVKLPCFIDGPVTDPKDNGGRPAVIVPISNVVEYTYTK
ncbi:hypothetical protein HBI46_091450 [Parastagonospora nodorum]|nr:hypothetical protein HBH75_157710 [Parastagonospora nodorum]KAH5303114.1 hypothetical protein HBI11_132940 [Parastagonospora nodorum]KAH5420555.1 hypothetical protein HBI46_091450 [Parastagonospora nodorum]